MITNNEFVSRIVNNIKGLSKDSHISKRFILNTGKTKSRFLLSQKLDELSMFREDGAITTVPCIELESIDGKSCDIFEFNMCQNIMRSKLKLPEGIFGKNGSGVVSVTNVDEQKTYKYITPNSFRTLQLRSKYSRDTTRYYYIKDGYLFLPNSTNELVEIRMLTLNKKEAEDISACKECSCKSIWEYEFVCPDRFLDLVVKDTLQEIASIYRTSIEDANPNMEPNQKTATTK